MISENELAHADLKELETQIKLLEQKLSKHRQSENAFYAEDQACFEDISKFRRRLNSYVHAQRSSRVDRRPTSLDMDIAVGLSKRLHQLEQQFHRKPRFFLTRVLGTANFIMHSKHRLQYKAEYENFKLRMTILHSVLCVVSLFIWPSLLMDTLLNFLLLYYYCAVTIREHILLVNGSNIREWWLVHHHLSIILSAVLLMWSSSSNMAFQAFRVQFYYFSICIGVVQLLQFLYQMERLYTLRALSKVGPMDVTTDAASVPIRGLAFLLPFLVAVQLFQIYNGYTLFCLTRTPEGHDSWKAWICSGLFVFLGLGNLVTTLWVYFEKIYIMFKIRRHRSWTRVHPSTSSGVIHESTSDAH